MNKYSYNKENQDAFGAWFDSIPSDKKQEYLDLLKSEDFGQWAYDALKEGNQDPAWCDSFHDSLFVWGDELDDEEGEIIIDEPVSLDDIEFTLQNLRSIGIFGDKEQSAIAAACHIFAELRLNFQYDPRTISMFNLSNLIHKEFNK